MGIQELNIRYEELAMPTSGAFNAIRKRAQEMYQIISES